MNPFIQLRQVSKIFGAGERQFQALKDINLRIEAGEHVAIIGKSGSGKSTLLNMLTGIDHPSSGRVLVSGGEVQSLSEGALAHWRGTTVGIVFQFFQLIPTLTIEENVLLPMEFVGALPKRQWAQRAQELLAQVGLEPHRKKLPGQLSGGEQQRAALARALANDPPLLVADEPTGNLDSHNASLVSRLLADLTRQGKTVVVVTHEQQPGAHYSRIITLADGQIIQDGGQRS